MQLEGFGHFCDEYCDYCEGELEAAIKMELEGKVYHDRKFWIEAPRKVPQSWYDALKKVRGEK